MMRRAWLALGLLAPAVVAPAFVVGAASCGGGETSPANSGGGGTGGNLGGQGGQGGEAVDALTVVTDSGPVIGTTMGLSNAWLGIPYAAPPIDALRWKSPQPAAPWTEPLDASEVGSSCIQTDFLSGQVAPGGSEDCLSLNVFAPTEASEGARPVMVWIHGGAFELGSGHGNGDYSGEHLAPVGDVIVVSFNYRLGPLGFLALPSLTAEDPARPSSGNYGLEDQRLALEWVQRNIAAFGGDPDNVTVFGESAGGISGCAHLISPESDGLFHRVLIESGPCSLIATPLAAAEQQGQQLADAVSCGGLADAAAELACLRATSPSDLLTALPNDPNLLSGNDTNWSPNIDGLVVPEAPSVMLENGNLADVPVLLGSNADEATLFLSLGMVTDIDEPTYATLVGDYATSIGSDQATLLTQYPAASYASPSAAFAAMMGHAIFNCPTRRMARQLAAAGNDTFLYHFTYEPDFPLFGGGLGAFHAAEVAFVFGTKIFTFVELTPDEQPLVDAMMGYWSRFSTTGDPNGGDVAWPKYDAAGDTHLTLDLAGIATGSDLLAAECDFWDSLP
jgi:para-nitrobenzyl esterase